MNIDLQEMDAGSVVRRRGNQGPLDKGGYNMFCTLIDRSLPNVHPYGNLAIRTDDKEPINGWANSPRIEELRAACLDTADLEQQKRICVVPPVVAAQRHRQSGKMARDFLEEYWSE